MPVKDVCSYFRISLGQVAALLAFFKGSSSSSVAATGPPHSVDSSMAYTAQGSIAKSGSLALSKQPSFNFPIEVKIGLKFISIGDINQTQQTFFCDFVLIAEWNHPDLHWSPHLSIKNSYNAEILFDTQNERVEGNKTLVRRTKRFRGDFYEHLELEEFPFDVQELTIVVRSGLNERYVTVTQNDRRHNTMEDSILLTEWSLLPGTTSEEHFTSRTQSTSGQRYSELHIKARAQRLWKFVSPSC